LKTSISNIWLPVFFCVIVLSCISCTGRKIVSDNNNNDETDYSAEALKFMFYNVENLFDIYDDSLTIDGEFLPDGYKHWTKKKYQNKINQIYKVIMDLGGWDPPVLIGLCEIENLSVLEDLINETPLSKYKYRIIHQESPDRRGIDVALLYRMDMFKPDFYKALRLNLRSGKKTSRDILYVRGQIAGSQSLHIFINHWPSKYGGEIASQPDRLSAAELLKQHTDSLFNIYKNPGIIITGDFNDDPDSKCLKEVLMAQADFDSVKDEELYNLSYIFNSKQNEGSYKYQGRWNVIDQFIVSGNLFNQKNKLFTSVLGCKIFKRDYLLEDDKSHLGKKPFRTYLGPIYHGGFSDHLPVYLELYLN